MDNFWNMLKRILSEQPDTTIEVDPDGILTVAWLGGIYRVTIEEL